MSARQQVAVRLSPDGIDAIDTLAREEHRTRSDMIRVLLIEAVKARQHRRVGAPLQKGRS